MKQEWKDWILNYSENKTWERIDDQTHPLLQRKYSFCTLLRDEIPFDAELDEYIKKFIGDDDYLNTRYILIKYEKGDFIGEHCDKYKSNVVTYVCELKPSNCNSKLIIDGVPYDEASYDNTVSHRVDEIKDGTRISLTMFGSKKTSLL